MDRKGKMEGLMKARDLQTFYLGAFVRTDSMLSS